MKEAIKIALLLLGVYLVWRYLSSRLGITSGAQPTAAAEGAPTRAALPSATPDLVAAAAAQAGYGPGSVLNADQWNYFYSQVRGEAGPDPLAVWPDRDRGYRMTLEEWWAGASQKGLAGVLWRPAGRVAVC